jgi:hypothetical protein
MINQKSSIPIFLIIIFTITITLSYTPRFLIASNLLPNVSPSMEDPSFWIKKIRDPGRLLLTPEGIQKMNEENLKRQDLLLCSVKDLKEEWTREEILTLLNEDWEGFGRTGEARYGRYGYPLEDAFWNGLKKNLNSDALKERNQLLFGLIVKRTDIRVFPTEELSMNTPVNYEFDRFQHSSVSPGSLVGIYHFSQDKLWAYVQTSFIRGWVRTVDLAIAKDRRETSEYGEVKERLAVTGNFVKVFGDPLFQQPILLTQMGSSFPMLHLSGQNKMADQSYIIKIPFRESDGRLTFRKGYIPPDEDVHRDFLPYTQENLARQAFKMLHQPYGWGEMFGARDCSRFIMDIFSTFGILMPRNSKLQAMVGINLGPLEEKSLKERKKVLNRAVPLATLLRLPGHIMLYLGKHNGKYYAIHNIWGIQKGGGWFDPVIQRIGKVVVSDLSLGRKGPYGSLLDRITEIQFIGSNQEIQRNP